MLNTQETEVRVPQQMNHSLWHK